MQSTRKRRFLDKELIVNALRSEYPEYNRKPWGVMSNLIARGLFFVNYALKVLTLHNILFLLALAVLDTIKDGKLVEDVSSEGSTIDIMSSGDEHIDITNDLDPPENPNHYITDVNSSVSELAQE